jgi:hypothetical protein
MSGLIIEDATTPDKDPSAVTPRPLRRRRAGSGVCERSQLRQGRAGPGVQSNESGNIVFAHSGQMPWLNTSSEWVWM